MVIEIPLWCYGAINRVSNMMTAAVTARSGASNKSQVRKHRPPERNEGQGTNLASVRGQNAGALYVYPSVGTGHCSRGMGIVHTDIKEN